jgi:hypothetical protein
MDGYREYRQRAITFIEARNRRILRYCSEDHPACAKEAAKPVPIALVLEAAPGDRRPEAVLELAGQYGTREELERAMKAAARKGLRVHPFKTCLMFTPASDARRCLFTLWAKREDGKLRAYLCTEAFTEFFSLECADVEEQLGPGDWRHFDGPGFEAFLQGVQALALGS